MLTRTRSESEWRGDDEHDAAETAEARYIPSCLYTLDEDWKGGERERARAPVVVLHRIYIFLSVV